MPPPPREAVPQECEQASTETEDPLADSVLEEGTKIIAEKLMKAYMPLYKTSDHQQEFLKNGQAALRSCWKDEGQKRSYVGYSPLVYFDSCFQHEYIRRFFVDRSAAISCALRELVKKESQTFADLRKNDTIHVCSLGGGPGCCIMGVKHLLQKCFSFEDDDIQATICDAVTDWEQAAHLQGYAFLELDFKRSLEGQHSVVQAVRKAQVIIMSYSLELVPKYCQAGFVAQLMAEMSPGSVLIIVDTYFKRGGYMPNLTGEAEEALNEEAGAPGVGLGHDPHDEKQAMAVKVWRKQGQPLPSAHELHSESNEDGLVGALGSGTV